MDRTLLLAFIEYDYNPIEHYGDFDPGLMKGGFDQEGPIPESMTHAISAIRPETMRHRINILNDRERKEAGNSVRSISVRPADSRNWIGYFVV